MMSFISSTVNPDAALYALWSLATWLGVRLLVRGITVSGAAALCALVGLTICVKAIGYVLLPPALLALGLALWARRPLPVSLALKPTAAAVAALAATAGVWFFVAHQIHRPAVAQTAAATASGTNFRELASYLWQFYLPRAPFQIAFPTDGVFEIFVKGSWGKFGWLEVQYAEPVYGVLTALTLATIAAAALVLWRTRKTIRWRVVFFLAATCVTLLATLHWTDYHQLAAGSPGFMQARYLFPLVGIAGLVVAQALRLLVPSRRAIGVGALLGGLCVLQLYALCVSAVRFYA